MSSNILEELYNGKIYPAEDIRPRGAQYWQRAKEEGRQYDELLEQFKRAEPSLAERLTEVMESRTELISEEMTVTFTEGFRLGAQMMLAILNGREQE